jgi:hypothetical protein
MSNGMEHDVEVAGHGSISTITPVTEAARQWIAENVQAEAWQWLGRSLTVETRFLGPLVEGMINDGLSVDEIAP